MIFLQLAVPALLMATGAYAGLVLGHQVAYQIIKFYWNRQGLA